MKLIIETMKYLKPKKLLVLYLCGIPFSLLSLLLTADFAIGDFLLNYDNYALQNLGDVLDASFGYMNIWLLLPIYVIGVISSAYFCGILDRDMRLGDFSPQHFFKRVNHNFLISATSILFVICVYAFFKVLFSCALVICHNTMGYPVNIIVSSIMVTLLYFGMLAILSSTLMTIPVCVDRGVQLSSAISDSFYYLRGRFWKVVFAIAVPAVVRMLVLQAMYLLYMPLKPLYDVLVNSFMFVYIVVLAFVTYYDAVSKPRADKLNIYNW